MQRRIENRLDELDAQLEVARQKVNRLYTGGASDDVKHHNELQEQRLAGAVFELEKLLKPE